MSILSQLCAIQLGHTARGRLEPAEDGGIRAVQLRDTRPEGGLAAGAIGSYRIPPVPDRYWTRQGDVLFRSRGDRNTATAIVETFGEPAVAVMPLVIIRPQPGSDPRYIAWCINQPPAQRHFDECARGTGMRMIPIGCLANLKIPLPDLATQRAIVEAHELVQREYELSTRLAEKRRQRASLALRERAGRNPNIHRNNDPVSSPRTGNERDQ